MYTYAIVCHSKNMNLILTTLYSIKGSLELNLNEWNIHSNFSPICHSEVIFLSRIFFAFSYLLLGQK